MDKPEVLSTTHVQPARRAAAACVPVPLVSAPSVAAPYAQALLLYDAAGADALDPDALAASLAQVLSAYPQLAGRLRTPPDDPAFPKYTRRFLRPWMEYGSDDPGFLLTFERRAAPLKSVLPAATKYERVYDFSALDFSFAPDLAPNLSATHTRTDAPLSGVKVTLFDDGAAFVIGTSHALMDAGALGTFADDWARIHALPSTQVDAVVDELVRRRRFDWEALDVQAAGELDAPAPDPVLVAIEGGLDVLRYDSWVDTGAAPAGMAPGPDPALADADAARGHVRGSPPPWRELGTETPRRYVLNFTAREVEAITTAARAHEPRASANDALVGHLWTCITRARGIAAGPLEFTMACDARRRLAADDAPGCFNVCLGLHAEAADVLGEEGWAAARIREAVDGVTTDRVAAWLHRRAHDLDFRREMICFPGVNSVCTTNWARAGMCVLDFGGGPPVYNHNLVQAFGGFATLFKGRGEGVEMGERIGEGRKWYEPGADVMLWLEESAMDRLVKDEGLRGRA